jgi:hypothetical protein
MPPANVPSPSPFPLSRSGVLLRHAAGHIPDSAVHTGTRCRAVSSWLRLRHCLTFAGCRGSEQRARKLGAGPSADGCQRKGSVVPRECLAEATALHSLLGAKHDTSQVHHARNTSLLKHDRPATSTVYCFMVVYPMNYALVAMHVALHTLAHCDQYAFFSNDTLLHSLDREGDPIAVSRVIRGSMEAPRGGRFDTALNTAIFMQVWTHIALTLRVHEHYDFIVKIDPDTMLLAHRLKVQLRGVRPTLPSIVANARSPGRNKGFNHVDGSLIVVTRAAVSLLAARIQQFGGSWRRACTTTSASMASPDVVGEDSFLRECLETVLSVKVVPGPTVSLACIRGWGCSLAWLRLKACTSAEHSAVGSMHPFKEPCGMLQCWVGAHEAWTFHRRVSSQLNSALS